MLELKRRNFKDCLLYLKDCINKRLPLSLIRLGDGESQILDYPETLNGNDLEAQLNLWFGAETPNSSELRELRKQLIHSCQQASVLAIPTTRQLTIHPRWKQTYDAIQKLRLAKRNDYIVDTAIHRYLQLSGSILNLLFRQEFLGLITSRNVTDQIIKAFQPTSLAIYRIKGEASFPGEFKNANYPEHFKFLLNGIKPPYRGAPYLVSAGLLGKIICNHIYSKGGIAIDIGSIFDGWANINSRPYFGKYPSKYYSIEHLVETASLEPKERLDLLRELLDQYEPSIKCQNLA